MSLTFKIALDRYLGGLLIFVLNFVARLLGFVMARDHSLRVRGDILVIKMLGGGSLVMALPALLGIRRAYPDVRLRLFTTGAVKPFAETLGLFDDILVLDDRSLPGLFASGLRLMRVCVGADTVIDLEIYSYLSTVLSLLTFARNRIGFFYEETGFRQRLHTHRIFFHLASPLYLHYDRIATILGAGVAPVADCAAQVRRVLGLPASGAAGTGRLAVGCGCSGLSSERKLTPAQWAGHVFLPAPDKQREVVFLGAPSDRDTSEKVIDAVRAAPGAWQGTLTNACGTTSLQDGVRLLAGCDEYWGIESSLLNYARLLGLRCQAYLGPTNPSRLRPMPGTDERIFYRKTLCSPCIHITSVPPCHGNNLCMQWLFDPVDAADPRARWLPVVMDGKKPLPPDLLPRKV